MHWSVPALLAILAATSSAASAADTVLSQFDSSWTPERWNKSTGTLVSTPDGPHAPLPQGTIQVSYKGTGFEGFVINPAQLLVVPNSASTVSLWVKGGGTGYPISVKFQDATGNKKSGDKDLEWGIFGATPDAWQQKSFTIPAEWARPVSIYALAVHNWDHQADALQVTYHVSELTTAP